MLLRNFAQKPYLGTEGSMIYPMYPGDLPLLFCEPLLPPKSIFVYMHALLVSSKQDMIEIISLIVM